MDVVLESPEQRPGNIANILLCIYRIAFPYPESCAPKGNSVTLENAWPPGSTPTPSTPFLHCRPLPHATVWHVLTYFAVCVPQSEDEVSQSQVHGGVSRILWKLIELIQLHHIGPHTQSFATLIGLVEWLEVAVHA